MKRKQTTVLWILLGILFWSMSAQGQNAEQLESEAQEARSEMSRLDAEWNRLTGEYNRITDEKKKLEKKRQIVENELKKAIVEVRVQQQRVRRAREEVKSLGGKIDQTERNIEEIQANLTKRAQTLMKLSLAHNLEYLLSSSDAAEMELRIRMLDTVADADAQLIERTVAAKNRLQGLKSEKEATLGRLETEEKALEAAKDREAKKRDELNGLIRQKDRAAANAQAKIRQVKQMRADLKKQLDAIMEKLKAMTGYKAPTKFTPPNGTVFELPANVELDGVYINMTLGSPVKLAADEEGEVLSIQQMRGFGQTVIVGHGGKITTVYGNLSSVSVKQGEKVRPRQIIGKSGTSPYGEMIYFAIFKNGQSVNPRAYIGR